jgi:endonuclease/exonuclease/phosphatase family metal-dependent hydrolase
MPKLNFLFWNIARKDLRPQLEKLAVLHQLDVLIIAENRLPLNQFAVGQVLGGYTALSEQKSKVQLFTRLPTSQIQLVADEPRYSVWLFRLEDTEEFLLVALHLPSKVNFTDIQQGEEAIFLNLSLAQVEKEYGIHRTVVVGDFNMHPFDNGMVSHAGFNSVMTRKIARKGTRKVQFRTYTYFYNPMWGFLGDLNDKVPGTFYMASNYHWHLYDQVLIRPELIKNFDPNDLEIITFDGESSFLNKNGRIAERFSDHLPLKFSLKY